MRRALIYLGLCWLLAAAASAAVIDFEAQAANAGGNLTGTPEPPPAIGTAALSGGELREHEIGLPADQTGVYATEGVFGSGETNPLVITLAAPINGFSIFAANRRNAV